MHRRLSIREPARRMVRNAANKGRFARAAARESETRQYESMRARENAGHVDDATRQLQTG